MTYLTRHDKTILKIKRNNYFLSQKYYYFKNINLLFQKYLIILKFYIIKKFYKIIKISIFISFDIFLVYKQIYFKQSRH